MKTAFLSALAIVLFATANAQTSQTQTVTLNLTNKIDITFVNGSEGHVFTFNQVSHYDGGQSSVGAAEFKVKSNRPWTVSVKANSNNFTFEGTAASTDPKNSMPASVLSVKLNGGTSSYESLSTTAYDIASGPRGSDNTFKIDYQAKPGFDYDAGTYKLDVVYTATQQ